MPKIPGRESTKLKIPLNRLVMGSFFFPWEERYAKRECIVEGCSHRIEDCQVANRQAGIAFEEAKFDRDMREGTLKAKQGPVCEHCVDAIMAQG